MIVGIGSRRAPKVEAVKAVFTRLAGEYPAFTVDGYHPRDVDSGTRETPVRTQQLMEGAYNRVQSLRSILKNEGVDADILIGLEGGVHRKNHHDHAFAFLQSWVYIETRDYGGFGSSGNLPLPGTITRALYEEGRSLGVVIDEFIGKNDIRNKEGSYGVLTDGHIPRQQSFETALYSALAPVYNAEAYSRQL